MRAVALLSLLASACLLTTPLDGLSGGSADAPDARPSDAAPLSDAAGDATFDGASGLGVVALRFFDTDRLAPVPGYESLPATLSLSRSALPSHVTLEAMTLPKVIGSVVFLEDGNVVQLENVQPYDIAGGSNIAPSPWSVPLGRHTFTAVPYPQGDAGGAAGPTRSVELMVTP